MLPDRWNPRLWLRDWLNAPSNAERAFNAAFKAFMQGPAERPRTQKDIDAVGRTVDAESSAP